MLKLKGAASYAQVCLRRHCRRSASGRRRRPRLSRRSWQRRATRGWRWRPRMPRRRRRQLPPLAPPRQRRHPSLRRQQLPLWRLRHHHRHRRRCSLRHRHRQHAAVWPRHALQPRLRRPRCPPWLQRWRGRQTRPPQAHRCGVPRLRLHPQLRLLQQRRHPPARRRRRRARCRSRRSSTPQTPVSLGGVKAGVHCLPTSAGVLCSCHACNSVAAHCSLPALPHPADAFPSLGGPGGAPAAANGIKPGAPTVAAVVAASIQKRPVGPAAAVGPAPAPARASLDGGSGEESRLAAESSLDSLTAQLRAMGLQDTPAALTPAQSLQVLQQCAARSIPQPADTQWQSVPQRPRPPPVPVPASYPMQVRGAGRGEAGLGLAQRSRARRLVLRPHPPNMSTTCSPAAQAGPPTPGLPSCLPAACLLTNRTHPASRPSITEPGLPTDSCMLPAAFVASLPHTPTLSCGPPCACSAPPSLTRPRSTRSWMPRRCSSSSTTSRARTSSTW